ncbi:MAG: hypothetical protein ACRCWM_06810 [Sarcina sp.]
MKIMTIRLKDNMHKVLKIKMAHDENNLQQYVIGLINADLEKENNKYLK